MNRPVFRLTIFLILLTFGSTAVAQKVYISRVAPGFPGKENDAAYRVELFNESTSFVDISGYYILSRFYSFKIPSNTYIRPYSSVRIGKISDRGSNLNIVMKSLPSYEANVVDNPLEGDYVVLVSPSLAVVDAFLHSPNTSVGFLPTTVILPDGDGSVELQDESDEEWAYLRNPVDPAVAFVRINQQWQANSRTTNLIPATAYRAIQIKDYDDGFVTLSWQTNFEKDCFFHFVERSRDGKNFVAIDTLFGRLEGEDVRTYEHLDSKVEKDRVYFYRVTHIDKFGEVIHSPVAKVRTDSNPSGFTFEIIEGESAADPIINIRFFSRQKQAVRIKLLDEKLRELGMLYNDLVDADKENLISYQKNLPFGKYYLIVITESQRYYEPFILEKEFR
ncbi:MAG: lamin tail domain-containing protein [Bacteroidota bacterium]